MPQLSTDEIRRTCDSCHRSFATIASLTRHNKNIHPDFYKETRQRAENQRTQMAEAKEQQRKVRHREANQKYRNEQRQRILIPVAYIILMLGYQIDFLLEKNKQLIDKLKKDLHHGPLTVMAKDNTTSRKEAIKYAEDIRKQFLMNRSNNPSRIPHNSNWQTIYDQSIEQSYFGRAFGLPPVGYEDVDDIIGHYEDPRHNRQLMKKYEELYHRTQMSESDDNDKDMFL